MGTMKDVLALVSKVTEDELSAIQALEGYARMKYEPDLGEFESELRTETWMGYNRLFNDRMIAYPINTWVCTDTRVGVYAYFFDLRLVAVSFQQGRKWPVEFHWISVGEAVPVRDFILSLSEPEYNYVLIDLNTKVDDIFLQ